MWSMAGQCAGCREALESILSNSGAPGLGGGPISDVPEVAQASQMKVQSQNTEGQ